MVGARGLRRNYGEVAALKGLSFEVDRNEIFGIIGPDGAGKTSLFRILTTLLLADGGSATVDGLDVAKDYVAIRRRVGYMPGRFSLYQDLSVEENLEFFATVFNTTIKENYRLIEDIYARIEPFKKRRAGALSGGMKQKLALCCALIHKPTVLFLDEPTTGVDPVSRREFWDMLRRLKDQGITILVSTPYMDEAGLCDRIALMQGGDFLDIDAPDGIVGKYGKELLAVRGPRMAQLLADLRAYDKAASCYAFGDAHHLAIEKGSLRVEELGRYLSSKGHEGFSIESIEPGVEDCFMDLASSEGGPA
jgi:ABC-2 type transport system ATP-binding protein